MSVSEKFSNKMKNEFSSVYKAIVIGFSIQSLPSGDGNGFQISFFFWKKVFKCQN
jgi:hypothetical protein